jgi:DNA-directed RNA polymerase subunit beta
MAFMTEIRRVIDNHRVQQEHIRNKVATAARNAFPIASNKYTLKATNIKVKPKDYTFAEEKKVILSHGSTSEPLVADLALIENKTGKIIDQVSGFRLMNVPVMTGMHTFIKNGNNYAVSNVVTLKPGIYPRRADNGQLEAHFNLAGRNFRMYFDGAKQNFIVKAGGLTIPLYSLLRAIGTNEAMLIRWWGAQMVNNMKTKLPNVMAMEAFKFLRFLNPRTELTAAANLQEIGNEIRKFLPNFSSMDPEVNERTIGKGLGQLNSEAFVITAGKLLRLYRGDKGEKIESRDNPVFKRLHTVDDQFAWDMQNYIPEMQKKIKYKLDYAQNIAERGIRGLLATSFLDKPINVLLTQSQRKNMPTQVNPLEIFDTMTKVTPLGEMGIKSLDQVPEESRYLQNGHLGIIDPLRTPESKQTGIDLRLTTTSGKDDKGDMYAYVLNRRTKKKEHVKVSKLTKSVVAFAGQNTKLNNGKYEAMKNGQVQLVEPREVDYQFETPYYTLSPTSTLIPLIDGMQGNRVIMASQMMTQALSLKNREAPFVQTLTQRTPGTAETAEEVYGRSHSRRAEATGTVSSVTTDKIVVRDASGKMHTHHLMDHYPLNQKSFLTHIPVVKVGDKVKKDQLIAKSNFTDDEGKLALGTNLRTAYMSHYGYNTNDALVISEDAAKKLASLHLTKKTYHKTAESVISKSKYLTVFPNKFTHDQLKHLDDKGIVKQGAVIEGGVPLVLALAPNEASYENKVLGNISKKLMRPYRDDALMWDSDKPGTVRDVMDVGKTIQVTILTEEPIVEGDKLTGRFGNKGVVSRIESNSRMPHTEDGKPLDILIGPTSVVGRVNPNQLVETALGKVARKTGQPIKLPHFNQEDNVEFAKRTLKKHGFSPDGKEVVTDPVTGRKIKGVMVGDQYILKLLKQTQTNFNAHGVGNYDVNEQPAKPGGSDSAVALGRMEVNALIANNARSYLKDAATVKSQRNDEYWNAVRLGLPTPKPKASYAYGKFSDSLRGAGIKVTEDQSTISLAPLTDNDIEDMSSGEIKSHLNLSGKDYSPVKGGLFDFGITGGLAGKRWSHINLAESTVNPVFEDGVRVLLGLSEADFHQKLAQHGGNWFKSELNNLNINTELQKAKSEIATKKGGALNKAVKKYNLLKGLRAKGYTRIGDAFVLSKLPITPPATRPIVPLRDGKNVVVSPINHLYSDIILRNQKFKELKKEVPSDSVIRPRRTDLYKNVKALVGLGQPTSMELKNKQVKGFLANLAGDSPKYGYIQSKLVSRKQDLAGRGTAIPDMTIDMDEIGLPEDMCWGIFEPYLMKELTARGYPAKQAAKMIEEKSPTAKMAIDAVVKKYPVLVNRAPTLWRHNMVGAYVRPVAGKTIRVNPFIEDGMNLDYDGDTLQIHVPATQRGVDDVKRMTLSSILFHDKTKRNNLLSYPKHESVMGIVKSVLPKSSKKARRFKTKQEAIAAYNRGELTINDPVEIG